MAASVTGPKANPADIAKIALDGVEAGAYEIVADETSRQVLRPSVGRCRCPGSPVLLTGLVSHATERGTWHLLATFGGRGHRRAQ
jgi:hypothetical protein